MLRSLHSRGTTAWGDHRQRHVAEKQHASRKKTERQVGASVINQPSTTLGVMEQKKQAFPQAQIPPWNFSDFLVCRAVSSSTLQTAATAAALSAHTLMLKTIQTQKFP